MRRRNLLFILCSFIFLSVTGNVLSGPSNMESLIPKETPDGWIATGTPQVFTKKTLFEHINGQADLFLQYGFERSIFTTYASPNWSTGTYAYDGQNWTHLDTSDGLVHRNVQAIAFDQRGTSQQPPTSKKP